MTHHPVVEPQSPAESDEQSTTEQSTTAATGSGVDAEVWERIVREQQQRVYRLAFRLTGTRADAEDLTHDVFVRIFRSLDGYTEGNFDGWVTRITMNLFRDRWRRRKRILIEPADNDDLHALGTASPSSEDAWAARSLDVDIRAALAALPTAYRDAIVLCDVDGMGYEQAAEVLGIKLGTVRSRLHRGRAMLRESLAHREPTRYATAQRESSERDAPARPRAGVLSGLRAGALGAV